MLASIPLNLHPLLIRLDCDEHKFGCCPGELSLQFREETSASRDHFTFSRGWRSLYAEVSIEFAGLEPLHFIFLADEDQRSSGGDHDNNCTPEEAPKQVGE